MRSSVAGRPLAPTVVGRITGKDEDHKAFQFADLSGYSFGQRLAIRAADLAFHGLIRIIGRTVRFEVEGQENWEKARAKGGLPIYSFWHDGIFLSTYFFRNRDIVVMTSQSFDGEYIARFIQRLGYGAARGSSTRGSVGAMIQMIRLMRKGYPAAFTIDGPKGPRHSAKVGPVLLAKKTGEPILPFVVTPSKHWSVKRSWDGLAIPKPFSRALVGIAPPIYVPANASDGMVEAKRLELQAALDALEQRGQQWRTGGTPIDGRSALPEQPTSRRAA